MYTGPDNGNARQTGKRVCLLTGAGGTLGSAFCRLFASRYQIAAVYHSKPPEVPSQSKWYIDPLRPSDRLPENDHSVYTIQADLLNDSQIERAVDLALARYNRIDLLVNAAGFAIWAPLIDSQKLMNTFDLQFHLNVLIPLKLTSLVSRKYWRERTESNIEMNRNIVNVSSIAGLRLYPSVGQSLYSASKAALNQLTFHMALEFQTYGLRVNAIAPNSFPQIISVDEAAASIVRLDEGDMSGKILILDRDGERLAGLSPIEKV